MLAFFQDLVKICLPVGFLGPFRNINLIKSSIIGIYFLVKCESLAVATLILEKQTQIFSKLEIQSTLTISVQTTVPDVTLSVNFEKFGGFIVT